MKKLLLIPLFFLLLACTVGPSKIAYGEQSCHFCRMTIVDKQHAAQFVNDKGKAFNFDAAECMINYLNGVDEESIGMLLVTDYKQPEVLIDATSATFVISEDIPSPMGANLSATTSRTEAEGMLSEKTGELYTWDELLAYFENL